MGRMILLTLLLAPAGARAAVPTAAQVLARVDATEKSSDQSKVLLKMTLVPKSGASRVRQALIFQKGTSKRLFQFMSPAEVRMVGLLARGDDIHIYLPSYRRVRRIASHVKNASFMGSDFSYDDMGTLSLGKDHTVAAMKSTAEHYILDLRPKSGRKKDYTLLRVWALKKGYQHVRTDYYKGKRVNKRMLRQRFRKVGANMVPHLLTMETLASGHKTVIEMVKIETGVRLRRRFFTTRYLKRQHF